MSIQALYVGVTGLMAAQRAIEVTAHNVANANTPGYSRQRVELVTNPPSLTSPGGMKGTGVTVADVIRIRNEFADSAFRAETANGAAWSARSEVLARAEQVLGSFDEGTATALSAFWASWDQLSLYPEDAAARQGVIDRGAHLARSLNAAARQLQSLEVETSARIRGDLVEVNATITEIARLNVAILDATVASQSPNDLMDQRDRLIDDLAAMTGATVRATDNNQVDVYLGSMAVVRGGKVADTLQASGTDPAVISFANAGTTAVPGGAMGARLELVHEVMPSLRADLDALAVGLRDVVNGQHTAGFDQDGAAGLDFFVGTGAIDLAVNGAVGPRQVAASASGAPADGNNALAVAGLRDADAVGTSSVIEALAAFGSRVGTLALQANTAADASDVVLTGLNAERQSTSGVSIDEELTEMIRFQRAYEAAARVITTVDEMLDVLINRTGLVGR